MKVWFQNFLRCCVLMCMSSGAYGQQLYFLIDMDSLSTDYKLTHFTLSSKELYGINHNIEIFNVLPLLKENPGVNSESLLLSTRYLFTFSVLPVFDSTPNWTEHAIKPDGLTYVGFDELLRLGNRTFTQSKSLADAERYAVLLKKGTKYYTSKVSFLQLFYVEDYPDVFTIAGNVIDVNQALLPLKRMKDIYENEYKGGEFPVIPGAYSRKYDNNSLERFYLSAKINFQNNDVGYQFWTFAPWGRVMDSYEWQRGIDRFVFVPGKGIVGGSYDFYFKDPLPKEQPSIARRTINMLEFKRNILDEKLMLAKELN